MRVGAVGTQVAMPQIRPVQSHAAVSGGATAAPPVTKSDQAAVLAVATMTAAPMPDAALVSMMQSMAGLSSGVM